jgi:hypothetical protein
VARHRDTDEGEEYADVDEAALAESIYDDLYGGEEKEEGLPAEVGETGYIEVTAQIEWAGTVEARNDGVRTTTFERVPLEGVKEAAAKLETARSMRGPFKSYRAKGWKAQLRQMLSTKRGQQAAREAGLNRDTIRRWQSGRQAPGAASQTKIASTYSLLGDPKTAALKDAQHGVAEALTGTLKETYGVNIRLRGITHLHIRD